MKTTFALFAFLIASTSFAAGPSSKLQWMEGKWINQGANGVTMEEYFTSVDGGMLMAMVRMVDAKGNVTFFEFIRIEERAGNLVLLPMPNGVKGVEFTQKNLTGDVVVFENPKHEFPSLISYEHVSPDTFLLRVEGKMKGEPVKWEFYFHRAK
jgi:hypothetical protein